MDGRREGGHTPAATVPLLLLGVEDVLKVAREELRENLVRVKGVGPAVLLVEDLGEGLAAGPVGDGGPVNIEISNRYRSINMRRWMQRKRTVVYSSGW